ncbi:hypothetical protein [Aliiglaciecola sp. LCG003]|uniref:tetratricopeptide repeat protein n=1 Tax=Aliiglaciecola sp. LCG003 TaxID=3053655 RepID=UPI002574819F|nr:hypothetical protein [Aliiglaciecola sp. LCG003]WJG09192.1 hypothetical protein QR722_17975 [Aliiglaciecola sp. LCG003]
MKSLFYGILLSAAVAFNATAQDPQDINWPELKMVQQQWAVVNYQLPKDNKENAFESLIKQAEKLTTQHQDRAEGHIWLGIVQSSMAGAKGGVGALKYAKAAKKHFEAAMRIDSHALQGSAMTSLGVLYHKLPGWPISFGSDKKAEQLLKKSLELNPTGIDANYFYAEFLYDDRQYSQAKERLLIAKQAAPRPERPLADTGRQGEINELLQKVESKL